MRHWYQGRAQEGNLTLWIDLTPASRLEAELTRRIWAQRAQWVIRVASGVTAAALAASKIKQGELFQ